MESGSGEAGGTILQDPFGSYFFALEIGGVEVAHFQEFSGIKTTADVFEIQEGGRNGSTIKRPGQSKFDNLVLKYATSASMALLAWRDEWLQDRFRTQSGAVSIRNNRGQEVRRYSFTGAWPVSWEGPSLTSSSSDLAVETLEIAIESLQVHDPGPPPPDRVPQRLPGPLDRNDDGQADGMDRALAGQTNRQGTPDHDRNDDGQADGMQKAKNDQTSGDAPDHDADGDGQVDGSASDDGGAEGRQGPRSDRGPRADGPGPGGPRSGGGEQGEASEDGGDAEDGGEERPRDGSGRDRSQDGTDT